MGKPFNGLGDWPLGCDLGQFSGWLSACDFLGRVGADIARVAPLLDMAKCCGWSVLLTDWAFVSAKPEWIQRDEIGRLHCETGPAIRYPDGFSVFAIHGVRLPERIICLPESITLSDINAENNVAVRRAMIERYGPERFLTESGAAEIHRDDFGTLFCMAIPEDEPLVMVKVVNSTPEPDGSFKDYFLRVPPTMERAREAVAWTFGKTEADYAPVSET